MTHRTKEFLERLRDSGHWNDDYDYSMVEYVNSNTKVIVIDKTLGTEHSIAPKGLLKASSCHIRNAKDTNQYIKLLFQSVHGDRYDYSEVIYEKMTSKVKILCAEHGVFLQSSDHHHRGIGCPKCAGTQKKSKKEIITQFKETHGGRYNYSKVVYESGRLDVTIICRVHGDFQQSPSNHKRGKGCPKCSGKGITNDELIRRFRDMHGDRYDYSEAQYKKSDEKIKIRCHEHGIFYQSPTSHASGQGCSKCSGRYVFSAKEIIKSFHEVHDDRYDYSEVVFKNMKSNVKIICRLHGEFFQSPFGHKSGNNCPKCAHIEQGLVRRRNTGLKIINRFKEIHQNRYDYSHVIYENYETNVEIICLKHGSFFQKPGNHLSGNGCPKCNRNIPSTKEIIHRFRDVHGDRYDYSEVQYKMADEKVSIICQVHGMFQQNPSNHCQGQGCPTCGFGWSKERVIAFVNDFRNEDILEMDAVELNMLISQGKLPSEFEELVFTLDGSGANSLKSLKEKLGITDEHQSEKQLEQIAEELTKVTTEQSEETTQPKEDKRIEEFEESSSFSTPGLPRMSNDDILVLDEGVVASCDDEAVEFFIQYKLRKIWNEVINDKRSVDDLKALKGGENASRLRNLFLEEYNAVINYRPPEGYSFAPRGEIALPNMMQKLTVNRIKQYKRYGNWSGTGAGKTISFIVASREINSRLTLVICLNSTISQLGEDILEVYPDSKVFTSYQRGQQFERNNYNYLLLNYEKFQQGYTEELFQDLNAKNQVDFIVLDEIHNTKQRDKEESKRRGSLMRLIGRSAENPSFHLLGMSATPVINNLIEAKSLLQMITGKQYADIKTRATVSNALMVFNQFLLTGVRYIPNYDITLKELTARNTPNLKIDGTDLIEELKQNKSKDYLGLEVILLNKKLPAIKPYLKPNTILYTYFTDDGRIPRMIQQYLRSEGFTSTLYTAEKTTDERDASKAEFLEGKKDIMIASRTIGTGVDGLQKVCNRMILLTLPWTDSEYTQLKGRIYRQGSDFGEVDIIIPQVYIDLDIEEWSWDRQRLQVIRDKRTLADAAVDGIMPSKSLPSKEKLCSESLQALKKWKERVNEGKITVVDRKDLLLPLRPEIQEYLRSKLGDFSELNKKWSTSNSKTTRQRLSQDKEEWFLYHSLYRQRREEWNEIPYIEISKKLTRSDWVIADMGCGENLLSNEIKNTVHAFDYVAIDNEVKECDICNVPLKDETVDAVVFSLSLMGTNYAEYIKEAKRITKSYGYLFLAEPENKWKGKEEQLIKQIEMNGFKVIKTCISSKFLYLDAMKD